jgi:hypothetical protein
MVHTYAGNVMLRHPPSGRKRTSSVRLARSANRLKNDPPDEEREGGPKREGQRDHDRNPDKEAPVRRWHL